MQSNIYETIKPALKRTTYLHSEPLKQDYDLLST